MSDLVLATDSAAITAEHILSILAIISRTLEETEDIAQGVAFRNTADTVRHMAQKAGLAREIAHQAVLVRIDAERRVGELLRVTPLNTGGRPGKNHSSHESGLPTLADLGLDANQSSRWQTMAAVPAERYEQFIDDLIREDREPTSAAVYRFAQNWLHKHASGQKPERVLATWFNEAGYGLEMAVKVMRTVRNIYHWRNKKIRITIQEVE